jgi:hypothetical protein
MLVERQLMVRQAILVAGTSWMSQGTLQPAHTLLAAIAGSVSRSRTSFSASLFGVDPQMGTGSSNPAPSSSESAANSVRNCKHSCGNARGSGQNRPFRILKVAIQAGF